MKIIEKLQSFVFSAAKDFDKNISLNEIKLEHPVDFSFGDYSTNVAMVLAKKLKTNPRELANKIKDKLNDSINDLEVVEKIETAGAGFINFYLKIEYLVKEAEAINYEIEYKNKLGEYGNGKTMVIDYSAPNIAKPFGIGHLRSTNIGQSIYNIYKILGWNCIGDNHIGDWGTQYGKLVAAIKHAENGDPRFKTDDNKKFDLDNLKIEDLEKLYVRFHKEAETDESLIEEGRDYFSKLEKGDKEAREIWQKCIEVSLGEFDKVYRLLDVKIDVIHGESFYEPMLEEVTKDIIEKGITKESDGAIIVEFDGMPPAMLRKSNGTTTYFTRDMATIKYRVKNWNPDLIIYEVGADQELHFKQVFRTAELMGWMKKDGLVHVAHGLIRWKTGKFSTRKGDTIHLSDVIDKAIEKAKSIADKSQITKEMSATEKEEMIKAVGIGAIKFNDLSSDPRKDVIFDWDQVMSLEGDSGPYLQYTYARCISVLTKTQIKEQKNINSIPSSINNEELSLVKEFYKFEEKVLEASKRYSPSVVAEYLLSIARKYNEFYGKHRIIDQYEEVFRIFLTRTTASVLEMGLHLLGIKTIDKM